MLLKQPIHSRFCLSRQGWGCSAEPAGLSPRRRCLMHPVSPGCNRPGSLLHLPLKQKLSSGPASQYQGHSWHLRASMARLVWSSQLPAGHTAFGPFSPSLRAQGSGGHTAAFITTMGDQPCKRCGEQGAGGVVASPWLGHNPHRHPSLDGVRSPMVSIHFHMLQPVEGDSGLVQPLTTGQESPRQCCRLRRGS